MNATVINAGVSGFSSAEELVFLENEGYKYQPDFVVLGFFANDFADNIKSGIYSVQEDSLYVTGYSHLPGVDLQNRIYEHKIIHFLGESSYMYAFVFNTIWYTFKNKELKQKREEFETEFSIANDKDYTLHADVLTEKVIERMYEFTSKRNIPLIILDIPQKELYSSIPETMVDHFRANSDTLFYFRELLKEYRNLSQTHVPYGHRHISAESHDLLGRKIAEYVIHYYKKKHTLH